MSHGHGDTKVAVAEKDADEHSTKNVNGEMQALVAKSDKVAGLTASQVEALRIEFGFNELAEKKRNPILMFLSFFWGPMPIMIWIAIIIEFSQGIITGDSWVDFAVLLVLQFANAIVGFVEEFSAGNAIDALKQQLAPLATVIRSGEHKRIPARELVPGDLIEIKLGDVVPADAILLEGRPVQVDQAALTGESLPVTLGPGSLTLMSSALKQGHINAIVVSTGSRTFIGNAAKMMAEVKHQGHLHVILLNITIVLCSVSVLLCVAIFAKLMTASAAANALTDGAGQSRFLQSLSVVVVILVASIPVAIEVVVTSTMAVGSHMMAEKKVIVARLSAIEELAGMTVLCSDKTGTLTLNQLSLREPILFSASSSDEMMFYAALASKRAGDLDAIDHCIHANTKGIELDATSPIHGATPTARLMAEHLEGFVEEDFSPFDPVAKRTEALVRCPDGSRIKVSKGAPQMILRLAHNKAEIGDAVNKAVDELSSRGFRALGVAMCRTNDGAGASPAADKWEVCGVISLFDPPRPDTKHTIEQAIANGIEVKMITGDHKKIAEETCRELGMGSNILRTDVLDDPALSKEARHKIILDAHGFAEVMPEHKFQIVQSIREQGFVTGMTGDGVNDAPALKRADIGIAVHGATDAARAAAAIVLTEPGISVIIEAIFLSRCIFQRMRNYIIYRVACTFQLLMFFFFGILCIDPDAPRMYQGFYPAPGDPGTATTPSYDDAVHAPEFTLPVLALVIITILNDGCMITISKDNVKPSNRPQVWNMIEVWTVAIVLGAVACFSSLILLEEAMAANVFNPGTVVGTLWGSSGRTFVRWQELKTIMYLKISVSDFLTLFSARTRTWFWERCLGKYLGIAFVAATGASTIMALCWSDIINVPGSVMAPLRFSGGAVVSTWVYCALWWLLQDIAKVACYHVLDRYRPDAHRARSANGHEVVVPKVVPNAFSARVTTAAALASSNPLHIKAPGTPAGAGASSSLRAMQVSLASGGQHPPHPHTPQEWQPSSSSRHGSNSRA